jgi:hypothetical protein
LPLTHPTITRPTLLGNHINNQPSIAVRRHIDATDGCNLLRSRPYVCVSGTAGAIQTYVNSKKMPHGINSGITHGFWYLRSNNTEGFGNVCPLAGVMRNDMDWVVYNPECRLLYGRHGPHPDTSRLDIRAHDNLGFLLQSKFLLHLRTNITLP